MMRAFIFAIALFLAACAAPTSDAPSDTQPARGETHSANDHIPPPGFPVSAPGKSCGGMTATPQICAAGEYCHRDIKDMCGAADAPGRCRTIPEACTMDYNPVCGCDGVTYSNECAANAKGISAASIGECKG